MVSWYASGGCWKAATVLQCAELQSFSDKCAESCCPVSPGQPAWNRWVNTASACRAP